MPWGGETRNASLVCIKHAALTNFLTARRHRAHPPSDYDGILALSAGSDYAQLCACGRRRAVLCEKPSYYDTEAEARAQHAAGLLLRVMAWLGAWFGLA